MQTSTIEFVDNTSSLHSFVIINKIVELIVADIRAIPEFQKLQRSLDLVLRICLLIENLIFENNVKGQPSGFKKDIAIKVFESLGWKSAEHTDFLIQSIQFLWSSDRIKKVKLTKRIWSAIKSVFRKNGLP
jgi:hypothetical protein